MLKVDVGIKVMSSVINLVKEANLKVVLSSLDCLQSLVQERKEAFSALINMTFDVLIPRLGDTKANVREKTEEVFRLVVLTYDASTMMDKMGANLGNRNVHIKTALLDTMRTLYAHTQEQTLSLQVSPSLCGKIASLLHDQHSGVRQLALDTLITMRAEFQDVMMATLAELKVKASILQQMEALCEGVDRNSAGTSANPTPLQIPTHTRTNPPTPPASSKQDQDKDLYVFGENESLEGNPNAYTDDSASPYSLVAIYTFLHDSQPTPLALSDEKEILGVVERVHGLMSDAGDWNKRIQGMQMLQALCWGTFHPHTQNPPSYIQTMSTHILKHLHEVLGTCITDLRSCVCVCACRTVCVISYTLQALTPSPHTSLLPILEGIWTKVVRVVGLKVMVMAEAARMTVKCMAVCMQHAQVFGMCISMVSHKNVLIRKVGLEILCMVCCIWSDNILDKQMSVLIQTITHTLRDADAAVRKLARTCYGVLKTSCQGMAWGKKVVAKVEDGVDAGILRTLSVTEEGVAGISKLPRKLFPGISIHIHQAAPAPSPSEETFPIIDQTAEIKETSVEGLVLSESTSTGFVKPARGASAASGRRMSLSGGAMRLTMPSAGSTDNKLHSTTVMYTSMEKDKAVDNPGANVGATLNSAGMMDSGVGMATMLSSTSNFSGKGLLSKPARRMSLSALIPPPPAQPHANANTISATAPAIPLPPADYDLGLEKDDKNINVEAFIPDTTHYASEGWGKENRRVSLTPNLPHAGIGGLGGGAKRIDKSLDVVPPTPIQTNNVHTQPIETPAASLAPSPSQAQTHAQTHTHTASSLLKASDDTNWTVRLKVVEDIQQQIHQHFTQMHSTQTNLSSPASHANTPELFDTYLSIICKGVADGSVKVAGESVRLLKMCMCMFPEACLPHLHTLTLTTLACLSDRRGVVRDGAGEILTIMRGKYTATTLTHTMSQVMLQAPARTLAAVMQYLMVIIPGIQDQRQTDLAGQQEDEAYVVDMLAGLVGKVGEVVCGVNPKPTITITAASKRLLVMLFKMHPQRMLHELSRLKFQQQDTLRSLLKGSVPELEGTKIKPSVNASVSGGVGGKTTVAVNKVGKSNAGATATTSSHAKSPTSSPSHSQRATYHEVVETSALTSASPIPATPAMMNDIAGDEEVVETIDTHASNVIDVPSSLVYSDNVSSTPIHTIYTSYVKPPVLNTPPQQPVTISVESPINVVSPPAETSHTALHMKIPGSERTLQYVLHGLATTATKEHRREVYQLLKQLARMGEADYWKKCGHQVLEGLLGAARVMQMSYVESTREDEESVLSLLLLLLKHRGPLIPHNRLGLIMEMCMSMVVSTPTQDAGAETIGATEATGGRWVLYKEITTALSKLLPELMLQQAITSWSTLNATYNTPSTSYSQALLVVFHTLTTCVPLLKEQAVLMSHTPYLTNQLVLPYVQHESVSLRKASIFLLVEMFLVLQQALLVHIQDLPIATRQLMMIYVEKRRAAA
eukprot:gene25028-30232_t